MSQVHFKRVSAIVLLLLVLAMAAVAMFRRESLPGYVISQNVAKKSYNVSSIRHDVGRDVKLEYRFSVREAELDLGWLPSCKSGKCIDKYWANGLPDDMSGFLQDVQKKHPCISRESGRSMIIICDSGEGIYWAYYHDV